MHDHAPLKGLKMQPLLTAIAVAAFAVFTGACSKSESEVATALNSAAPVSAKKADQKALSPTYPRVEINTTAGLFWFEPRRCVVGPDADSGVLSYSIEGAGQSPDGQPVYVTLEDEDDDPAQGPEMRINVGTNQPLKTPEVAWITNDATASSLQLAKAKVEIDKQRVTLDAVVFSRNGNDRLEVKGPIHLDCANPG